MIQNCRFGNVSAILADNQWSHPSVIIKQCVSINDCKQTEIKTTVLSLFQICIQWKCVQKGFCQCDEPYESVPHGFSNFKLAALVIYYVILGVFGTIPLQKDIFILRYLSLKSLQHLQSPCLQTNDDDLFYILLLLLFGWTNSLWHRQRNRKGVIGAIWKSFSPIKFSLTWFTLL